MIQAIKILLAVILVSFYVFPVFFVFLPGLNTKMILAVIGLLFFAADFARKKNLPFTRDTLVLFFFAIGVSIVSLLSISINQTPDTTYVSYFISFLVWFSASYAVCHIIKDIHGYISIQLLTDYLVAMCVSQCAITILSDSLPAFRAAIDAMVLDHTLPRSLMRLCGFGASLDTAGVRYSLVLTALGYQLSGVSGRFMNLGRTTLYVVSFIIIAIVGNMVARTTLVGVLTGLAVIVPGFFRGRPKERTVGGGKGLVWVLALFAAVIISVWLFNSNMRARGLFRFAFEGFFSLYERNEWMVGSTETLKSMIVFPETIHTWIIGDGYFLNARYDSNYLGESTELGYYMGTDVGYLRFIFYFGVTGLLFMAGVIVTSAILCMHQFPKDKLLFLLVLIVGFAVWMKVATDVFMFFALFISISMLEMDESVQKRPMASRSAARDCQITKQNRAI